MELGIVRLLTVRNEEDIIKQNLDYYHSFGIKTIVLDNGSSDKTKDICKSHDSVVAYSSFESTEHSREFGLKKIWNFMIESNITPKIVIIADADEFLEPYDSDIPLDEFLENGLNQANVMQTYNMEFYPTKDDSKEEENVLEKICHYSFFPSHLFRAFNFIRETNIWSSRGHCPVFPSEIKPKLSKKSLILRHYKFRTKEQALKKVRRIQPPSNDNSSSIHYLKYKGELDEFFVDSKKLSDVRLVKWNWEVKYTGKRMSRSELKDYLELKSDTDLDDWFIKRNPLILIGRQYPWS